MKIISCKKDDLNHIVNIEYEVNKKLYGYKSKTPVKNMLNKYFNKTNFFIIKDNNKITGYMSLVKLRKYGGIVFIAVKGKYHRKGIGSKLIKFAETYFKRLKCKGIKLHVLSNNLKTIEFYKYHKFNILKKYKKGKRFKLVMSKEI